MLGGGRGRNPIRHTTYNSGHFKHKHNEINPIRHTTCNSGNLLYNTYRLKDIHNLKSTNL